MWCVCSYGLLESDAKTVNICGERKRARKRERERETELEIYKTFAINQLHNTKWISYFSIFQLVKPKKIEEEEKLRL